MSRSTAPSAIFVDESGLRARRARSAARLTIIGLVAAFVLAALSALGGVPMPGLTRRVALPARESAHPRAQRLETPAPPPPALPAPTPRWSSITPAAPWSAAPAATTGPAAAPRSVRSTRALGSPTAAPTTAVTRRTAPSPSATPTRARRTTHP